MSAHTRCTLQASGGPGRSGRAGSSTPTSSPPAPPLSLVLALPGAPPACSPAQPCGRAHPPPADRHTCCYPVVSAAPCSCHPKQPSCTTCHHRSRRYSRQYGWSLTRDQLRLTCHQEQRVSVKHQGQPHLAGPQDDAAGGRGGAQHSSRGVGGCPGHLNLKAAGLQWRVGYTRTITSQHHQRYI